MSNHCVHYDRNHAVEVTTNDKEIIIEQLKFLFSNLPPKESAKFIFDQLYCYTSSGTANPIVEEFQNIIKHKHVRWSYK